MGGGEGIKYRPGQECGADPRGSLPPRAPPPPLLVKKRRGPTAPEPGAVRRVAPALFPGRRPLDCRDEKGRRGYLRLRVGTVCSSDGTGSTGRGQAAEAVVDQAESSRKWVAMKLAIHP